jgi:sortase A
MGQTSGRILRALKWAEVCLWIAGIFAVGYCASIEIRAWLAQTAGNREIEAGTSGTPRVAAGSIVGRLEIPRLGTSVVVFEGTDAGTLDLGAGHWSGSPLPGADGNVVMAAHRDTFFRSLRNIRDDDAVDVATTEGTRHYLVDSTRIVNPNDLAVLAPTSEPSLTLITCYPFEYFGHAPKRFIVRARLAEGR